MNVRLHTRSNVGLPTIKSSKSQRLQTGGLKLCFIWLNIASNKVNFKIRGFYVKVHY